MTRSRKKEAVAEEQLPPDTTAEGSEGRTGEIILNPSSTPHENGRTELLQRARDRLTPQRQQGHEQERAKLPDPHFTEAISLTDKNDGPRIHLGRSQRHGEMLIKFDQKPEGEMADVIFTALKDKGFHWNRDAKAWTMKIDPHQKWQSHQSAEKLFRDVANTLREQNGLQPVSAVGVTA